MIPAVIRWSIEHRFIVVVLALGLAGWGVWAVGKTPVDAIPDLSDVQVIVKTTYPGQAPQVVEDQVTYPIATAMLSVPGARDVRGFSFFGDSYVYVLFADGTDLYWARSRVLEYLSQITPRLPEGAVSALGPDATGVGWIYQYALIDRTGGHDISELRAIQDWFLKFELQTVPGVADVRRRLGDTDSLVAGLRYFNVYGPREQHKGRMASVAWHLNDQMRSHSAVRLFRGSHGYADGEQRRDFVYVDDVVDVTLWFGKQGPGKSGIYNCGTGRAETFNAVAKAVINWYGTGATEYSEFPPELITSYQAFTQADLSRLRAAGYEGNFRSVADGVREYLNWLNS